MKTIPKFPDLMAEADKFEEETEDGLPRKILEMHSYKFKNGYGVTLIVFSPHHHDSSHDGSIEAYLLEEREGSFTLSYRPFDLFGRKCSCRFDGGFKLYDESEVRQAIEYVRDLE